MESKNEIEKASSGRRAFLKGAGISGLGAAAALAYTANPGQLFAQGATPDTVAQILTAALIAEDLATTFYYNGLVGKVIEDPALAGSGGGVIPGGGLRITNGNAGNVRYIQAALSEEVTHANLLRSLLKQTDPSTDPAQTFYFSPDTFSSIGTFTATLDALENAFIGAYLNAIREFSALAAKANAIPAFKKDSQMFTYYAVVAASIMGVEAEHRTLGRVISGSDPANNLNYESYDGLTSVYNGPNSAVAALTPFITPSNGQAYTLADALANQASVSIPVSGGPPAMI